MTTVGEQNIVEVDVKIAAKPETIFPFLIEAAKVPKWFGASAQLEAKPGGIYRVALNDQAIALGEIVEIEPNKRVAFTFGWEGAGNPVPPGSSRVEITLEPDGDATVVRLRHTDLPAETANDHRGGWTMYAGRLKDVVEGRDPGRDPNAQA